MNEQLSIIMDTFERSVEHFSVVAEQKGCLLYTSS